jgi:DNA-binding transcriptional LysR family regulator
MPGSNSENNDRMQRLVELPALDLRRLRYFAAVAEELSFSQAADRLGLSQQALSSQIRRLEDQVGRSLFFRTTRRVELTVAGRALLPKAQLALGAALEALDTARAAEPEHRYKPWL